MKRFLLIACGVLKQEIASVSKDIPDDIELSEVWLEQGLHREPERLNTLIKREIRKAEESGEEYDAILLGYGICSHGTVGISSNRFRMVVPRAHDCITLFLGSKERYLDEFSRAPGTYWFTPGFISGSMQPGLSEKYAGIYQQFEDNYTEYLKRFGDEDMAKFVIDHQEQAWIKNYSRGAYVRSDLKGGEGLRKKACAFCEARGWDFDEVTGDFSLLRDLISGQWDPGRFLVLEPGQTLSIGGIDEVITAIGRDESMVSFGDNYEKTYVYDGQYHEMLPGSDNGSLPRVDRVIGIDAGGTYTDAAVVSLTDRAVLVSAKAPTTRYDLAEGIRNALTCLPSDMLESAERLAISTTLATNAIVEEKGGRTGLILIGYDEDTATRVTIGAGDIRVRVSGRHDIYGTETEPLDESGLKQAAELLVGKGVEALAVSSYMGTRNPAHEKRAMELLVSMVRLPVACGHELTDDIDSVRRAMTVLLNARLLPVITHLVESIEKVAGEIGLPSDIRFMTTDGSLMNTAEARRTPVRMILSGPAASVAGVRFLSDLDDCVLADMGGTTTDLAVIEGGSARRTGRGAVVGGYRTSIHATDMRTLGLGGDSAVKLDRNGVHVGPERILPISVCARRYPEIVEKLDALIGYESSDYGLVQPGTFFMLQRALTTDMQVSDRENRILSCLQYGPRSIVEIGKFLDYQYLSLLGTERLEELGIILRVGLTPTDLMALENDLPWADAGAAHTMLSLYAERSGYTGDDLIGRINSEIARLAAAAVITEIAGNGHGSFPGCDFCGGTFGREGPLEVTYRLKTPLIGIGAPARHLLGGLDAYLDVRHVYPEHGEVANAVGAAAGAGGMHIDMHITMNGQGKFVLFSPDGQFLFGTLDEAKSRALTLSRSHAADYAEQMGYNKFRLTTRVRDRGAPSANAGDIYIDTAVLSRLTY